MQGSLQITVTLLGFLIGEIFQVGITYKINEQMNSSDEYVFQTLCDHLFFQTYKLCIEISCSSEGPSLTVSQGNYCKLTEVDLWVQPPRVGMGQGGCYAYTHMQRPLYGLFCWKAA